MFEQRKEATTKPSRFHHQMYILIGCHRHLPISKALMCVCFVLCMNAINIMAQNLIEIIVLHCLFVANSSENTPRSNYQILALDLFHLFISDNRTILFRNNQHFLHVNSK